MRASKDRASDDKQIVRKIEEREERQRDTDREEEREKESERGEVKETSTLQYCPMTTRL